VTLRPSATAQRRRQRLTDICLALPEAEHRGGQHGKYTVRGKTFAYYVFDEHGDGRIALCCKTAPGQHTAFVASDPERYYIPSYIGPKGWVALRLDGRSVDWGEVERLVVDSYTFVAPKKLAAFAAG
jgi:phosphoribosylglycinamide formyltransferase-1